MPSLELAATIGDQPISVAELDRTAGTRLLVLKSQEYALRSRVLRQEIERRLLEAEALRRSISVEDLLRSEVDAKLPAGDAQAPAPRSRMLAERRSEFLRELREKTGVWVFLEPPRIPVAIDPASPSRGPAEAAVTIVEFSDFQCPYCGRVEPTLKQLKDLYPGMIRFVFRDFPLPAHTQAPKAAEASACADEQGKFWEMHDYLFANQSRLQIGDLKRYAGELGLDQQLFDGCLDSGRFEADWRRDMTSGASYGVTGTPAFFINGRFLSGAQPLEVFEEIVREEIERSTPPTSTASSRKPGALLRKD